MASDPQVQLSGARLPYGAQLRELRQHGSDALTLLHLNPHDVS